MFHKLQEEVTGIYFIIAIMIAIIIIITIMIGSGGAEASVKHNLTTFWPLFSILFYLSWTKTDTEKEGGKSVLRFPSEFWL